MAASHTDATLVLSVSRLGKEGLFQCVRNMKKPGLGPRPKTICPVGHAWLLLSLDEEGSSRSLGKENFSLAANF